MPLDNPPHTAQPHHPADDAPLLQHFVAGQDIPCPACGYNLRGLKDPACPECAQPLTLRVALAEPMLATTLTAASGVLACAATGLVGLVLVFGLCIRWSFPPSKMWFAVFGIPILMSVIGGSLAGLLLRSRGRVWLLKATPRRRLAVTILGWTMTLMFVVLFVVTIRE